VTTFLALTITGIVTGCIYALFASGLVVTYTTSGIFNFAHGAIAMIAAFSYWSFTVDLHWPTVPALLLVLFVLAPAMGAVIERVLMRPLRGKNVDTQLTVTLGLLLFLLALATIIWSPDTSRVATEFFTGKQVSIFSLVVTWNQIAVVIVTIVVAVLLRLFLFGTRPGTAMRAVVDDAELASMTGASPARFGQYGWMLGCLLAALAGVLLAPLVTLDTTVLTLLIINAYAAAMVGRLRSLPLTFVGGLALGLAISYAIGYLPSGQLLNTIQPIVPMIFLFLVLLILPQSRLRAAGQVIMQRAPRVARFKESVVVGAGFVVLAWIISGHLSVANLGTAGHGVALALVMLSLVLLTGYGGQVSLCQLTFAGLGAFAMGKVAGGGSWLGVLAAVGLAGAVGALVALPALRLRGLYLALATLAFAQAMDLAFFTNANIFGNGGSISVNRIHIPGIPTQSNRAFFVLLCVVFAVVAVVILAVRRSAYGRRLTAMSDSPAACATLGLNLTWTKLTVFFFASALAGLAGALYGMQQTQVGANDFTLLLSLTVLLLASVWGIKTVTGTLLAGLSLVILQAIAPHLPHEMKNIAYLAVGLGAISLGRNPNGIMGTASQSPLQKLRDRRAAHEVQSQAISPQTVEDNARIAG
jgi:branched-chain amino acid transport system permease protein